MEPFSIGLWKRQNWWQLEMGSPEVSGGLGSWGGAREGLGEPSCPGLLVPTAQLFHRVRYGLQNFLLGQQGRWVYQCKGLFKFPLILLSWTVTTPCKQPPRQLAA